MVECETRQQRRDRVEEPKTRSVRIECGRGGFLDGGGPQSLPKLGNDGRDFPSLGSQRFQVAGEVGLRGAASHDLNERPVGRGAGAVPASSPDDGRAPCCGTRRELFGQPSLANSGLAAEQKQGPRPERVSLKPASSSASSRSRPMKEEPRGSGVPSLVVLVGEGDHRALARRFTTEFVALPVRLDACDNRRMYASGTPVVEP